MFATILTDYGLDALLGDLPGPRGWYRSERGNLTRSWNGFRLTVFGRYDGLYGWSLHGPGVSRYGRGIYRSEAAAVDAVLAAANDEGGAV